MVRSCHTNHIRELLRRLHGGACVHALCAHSSSKHCILGTVLEATIVPCAPIGVSQRIHDSWRLWHKSHTCERTILCEPLERGHAREILLHICRSEGLNGEASAMELTYGFPQSWQMYFFSSGRKWVSLCWSYRYFLTKVFSQSSQWNTLELGSMWVSMCSSKCFLSGNTFSRSHLVHLREEIRWCEPITTKLLT